MGSESVEANSYIALYWGFVTFRLITHGSDWLSAEVKGGAASNSEGDLQIFFGDAEWNRPAALLWMSVGMKCLPWREDGETAQSHYAGMWESTRVKGQVQR